MTDNDEGQFAFDRANGDSRSSITEDRLVESIYKHLMESLCQDVAVNMHELIKTGADDVIPSSWKLFSGSTVPSRRDLYPELYNGENADETKEEEKSGENDDTENESTQKRPMSDSEIEALLNKYAVNLPNESATKAGTKRRKRDIAEEEEKRLLLSKIQKEKESNYKDSDDEEEDDNTNDEDDDDEDFKMEDADDDDDNSQEKTKKRGRSMSTSSAPEDSKAQPDAPESTTKQKENNKLDIWGKNPAKEPKNRLCRCQISGRLISTSRFAYHLDKCMGLSSSRTGGGTSSSGSSLMAPTLSMGAMGTKKRSVGTR